MTWQSVRQCQVIVRFLGVSFKKNPGNVLRLVLEESNST